VALCGVLLCAPIALLITSYFGKLTLGVKMLGETGMRLR
jgi:hypothetical protein